jgi:RND family efflux transporter MFP subunit
MKAKLKSASLTVLVVLSATTFTIGCDKSTQKAALPETVPEKVVQKAAEQSTSTTGSKEVLTISENKNIHVVSGQVVAMQSASLGFQAAGFIVEIQKDAGDVVKKDEVLAVLDDADAKIQLQVAQVRLSQSVSALEAASRELDREKQLKKADASSAANFDRINSSYDQARSAKDLAALDVTKAQIGFDRTRLKAPYDGIVSTRVKNVGDYVTSGATIFDFVSSSNPEIRLQLPEQLLSKIKKGQEIDLVIPAINEKTKGTISRIVPVISDRSRSFIIHAKLNEPKDTIVPGLFVEAKIDSSGGH